MYFMTSFFWSQTTKIASIFLADNYLKKDLNISLKSKLFILQNCLYECNKHHLSSSNTIFLNKSKKSAYRKKKSRNYLVLNNYFKITNHCKGNNILRNPCYFTWIYYHHWRIKSVSFDLNIPEITPKDILQLSAKKKIANLHTITHKIKDHLKCYYYKLYYRFLIFLF